MYVRNFMEFRAFHPLETVDRASKTQLQVGENLSKISYSGEG